ncbi:hypothetical protein BH11PAT4_BH11PAT4_3470 [soil metagenome]
MRLKPLGSPLEERSCMDMKLNVIILAGDQKALDRKTPDGKLSYRDAAVTASLAVTNATRVVAVSNRSLGSLAGGKIVGISGGKSAAESLEKGISQCEKPCWLLIVAADLPHINGDALKQFADGAMALAGSGEITAFIGYSSLEQCAVYNHTSKRPIILDGKPTKLASVFLVHTSVLEANKGAIGKLLKQRKSPFVLGIKLLGIKWALKYLTKRNVPSGELQAALNKRNGFKVAGLNVDARLTVDDDTK